MTLPFGRWHAALFGRKILTKKANLAQRIIVGLSIDKYVEISYNFLRSIYKNLQILWCFCESFCEKRRACEWSLKVFFRSGIF